jgi:D-3-phosphoglycerate dehydrogenase
LKGLLEPVLWEKVNYVNARLMAEERGIKIYETKEDQSPKKYKNLINIKFFSPKNEMEISGTISRARNPLLVEINGYEMEADLEGYVLMLQNEDRPGVVGPLTMAMGEAGVNIASMRVARKAKGETAIMILNVDNKVEDDTIQKLTKINGLIGTPKLLHF